MINDEELRQYIGRQILGCDDKNMKKHNKDVGITVDSPIIDNRTVLTINKDSTIIKKLIDERGQTHGDFKSNAELSQAFKFLFRNQPSYLTMDVRQKEALDMIAGKLARIFSGNAKFKDHWLDGSGYFLLGMKACDDC